MSTEIQMKTCNICGISKSLDQFTGRYAKCNACRSKERRQLSQPSKQIKPSAAAASLTLSQNQLAQNIQNNYSVTSNITNVTMTNIHIETTYNTCKLEYTFNYLNLAVNAGFQKLTDEFNKQILALVKKYKEPGELFEKYNKLYSDYHNEYEEARSKLRKEPIAISEDDWVNVKSKIDELYQATFEENTLDSKNTLDSENTEEDKQDSDDSDFVSNAAVVKPHINVELDLDNLMRYLAYYSLDNIKPKVLDLFYEKINKIYQKFSDDEKRRKEELKKIESWELPYYTRAKVTVEYNKGSELPVN